MRVLVVEDEPLIAASIEWELRDAGYEVIGPAADAVHAAALARAERPDLALVDINLTCRGDGVALARGFRRLGIASIFVSGQVLEARENRDAALGLVAKPFCVEHLPAVVRCAAVVLAGGWPAVIPPALELFSRAPPARAARPVAYAAGR
ncbi:response regulator [Phenylobacterium sp.]|uniref:response regulator n=1 Tax=Phenylobacterium sp. TaxID=1871053 RepID=UPI002DF51588|nr:response regulator [Phenylobacterium sp.]